jgi:hypothetical protein
LVNELGRCNERCKTEPGDSEENDTKINALHIPITVGKQNSTPVMRHPDFEAPSAAGFGCTYMKSRCLPKSSRRQSALMQINESGVGVFQLGVISFRIR